MIFNQKTYPKLFWVEGLIYLAIVGVSIAGSCGHFDGKAQGSGLVDTCGEWTKMPAMVRVQILHHGIVTELRKAEIEGAESLIDCLSERDHIKILDEDIVAGCSKGEAFLADVFDRSIERVVFRCLKWVNETLENFEIDGKKEEAKSIE